METSTSLMVMMTLTVCNPSEHDAFHRGKPLIRRLRAGTLKHPSSHRTLAIKSGRVGRSDAVDAHVCLQSRRQSPGLFWRFYVAGRPAFQSAPEGAREGKAMHSRVVAGSSQE